MTDKQQSDKFTETVREVLTNRLLNYGCYGETLTQIGIIRAGATAAEVEAAFGPVLNELRQSPPGLHDQGSDRVFWVEEFAPLFALYAEFKPHKSGCVLLVDRRVAINPYLEDVAATLTSAAEVRRRRMES